MGIKSAGAAIYPLNFTCVPHLCTCHCLTLSGQLGLWLTEARWGYKIWLHLNGVIVQPCQCAPWGTAQHSKLEQSRRTTEKLAGTQPLDHRARMTRTVASRSGMIIGKHVLHVLFLWAAHKEQRGALKLVLGVFSSRENENRKGWKRRMAWRNEGIKPSRRRKSGVEWGSEHGKKNVKKIITCNPVHNWWHLNQTWKCSVCSFNSFQAGQEKTREISG